MYIMIDRNGGEKKYILQPLEYEKIVPMYKVYFEKEILRGSYRNVRYNQPLLTIEGVL